jgi:hypothetical protein
MGGPFYNEGAAVRFMDGRLIIAAGFGVFGVATPPPLAALVTAARLDARRAFGLEAMGRLLLKTCP